jgi:hypothetical protein
MGTSTPPQTLSDERLACGLHDTAADHEALALPLSVAHSMLVFAKVGESLRDCFKLGMLALQVGQRRDHGFCAIVLGQQAVP